MELAKVLLWSILLSATAVCETDPVEFCIKENLHFYDYADGGSISIFSPQYPSPTYTTNQTCEVKIAIDPIPPIGFQIEHHNFQNVCSYTYSIVDANNHTLPTKVSCTGLGKIVIDGINPNSSSVVLKLTLPEGSNTNGFNITFTALHLNVIEAGEERSIRPISSEYVVSHEGFNFGLTTHRGNQKTQFTLTNIDVGPKHLVIDFIYFNIGNLKSCQTDAYNNLFVLLEDKSGSANQLFSCGDTSLSPPQWIFSLNTNTTSLIFEINMQNESSFKGFLLRYSVVNGSEQSWTPLPTSAKTSPPALPSAVGSSSTVSTTAYPTTLASSSTAKDHTNSVVSTEESRATQNAKSISDQFEEFFATPSNIVAVAAGGGGLILIILILVLACVVCRKSKDGKSEQMDSDDAVPDGGFVQINLGPVTSETSKSLRTRKDIASTANTAATRNAGDKQSFASADTKKPEQMDSDHAEPDEGSVERNLESVSMETSKSAKVREGTASAADTATGFSTSIYNTPSENTNRSTVNTNTPGHTSTNMSDTPAEDKQSFASADTKSTEAVEEVEYTSINKLNKVHMEVNDLYGTKDSLSSDEN